MTAGTLYLIPNTLGDGDAAMLAAVLPAAVQARAASLGYYIGENAKTTRAFLKKIGTERPIQEIEIRELNVKTPASEIDRLLAPVLAGADAGLVSEAGCPAVADPGALLVRRAHERGVKVVPLVGPSSILLALMASGLNGQSFAFHGYLPVDAAARAKRLRELEQQSRHANQTQIFIETPYRNHAMLDALVATCAPSTLVCVAADLTLATETIASRPAAQWKRRPCPICTSAPRSSCCSRADANRREPREAARAFSAASVRRRRRPPSARPCRAPRRSGARRDRSGFP